MQAIRRERIYLAIAIVAAVVITLLPSFAHAASFDFSGTLVPEICKCKQIVTSQGQMTTAPAYGCVLQTLQNVIRFVFAFAFLVATLAFIYAGFTFITSGGNPGKREQGKNLLLNVMLGIGIMLAAWLIVDFVMKTVYNGENGGFGPWNNILAPNGASACLMPTQPIAITSGALDVITGAPVGSGIGVSNPGSMTDQQARAALQAGGVEIYNWNATRSLANTRIDTINQAIEVKRACNCRVLVTATTGGQHATGGGETHEAGYKIDIDDNPTLDAFLRRLRRNGSRSDGTALYYDSCGNEYARESSHWDITVNHGVCRLGS